MPVSGIWWVNQFPNDKKIQDLASGFQYNVVKFLDAMVTAGVSVTVAATRRPAQRAYLMHYAWCISREESNKYWVDPAKVPAYAPQHGAMMPVHIEWLHTSSDRKPDTEASKKAAIAMVHGFGIAHTLKVPPALSSLHIKGEAIDMNLAWTGTLSIVDGNGAKVIIATTPRNGTNLELIKVGASYRVIHLTNVYKDPPHWSTTGH